jgi:N-acetyl-gamma-glutamyl-phosphate reductase
MSDVHRGDPREAVADGLASAASRRAGGRITAGIVGGSGYAGALLTELLLRHDDVVVSAVSSASLRGHLLRQELPRLRTDLRFCSDDEVNDVDVAFICLPHGRSAPVAKRLLDGGARVIDFSADFRLTSDLYAEWYGLHPFPELLPAVYGLPEFYRDAIATATLVANPGCYPTAALLALRPLHEFGLLDVVIDAKSGVSGAGKAANETTHFCAVDSDVVAYGLAGHRHYPEIAAGLAANGDLPALTFVPHLVPLQRGIVETIYARTEELPSAEELRRLYEDRYAAERFVEVVEKPPRLGDLIGRNYCRIFPTVDERSRRCVIVAAIDNLMKGASGQAVQNMNIMFGRPEARGLE